MAEITSSQHTIMSNSGPSSSYNISFNLSTISTYSSRFLAWIMHKDGNGLTAGDLPTPWPSLLDNSDSTMSATTSSPAPTASVAIATATTTTFPGPWAFFASGYMCGLVIMGVLMHRIDNVFVPSPNRFQHPGQARRFSRFFHRFLL
ncbi:hypothetical protein BDP27DRAFT_315427 [Rhodocollybia butyracea]|uniref:Uncharacterized protein n=1 Tax=Rhodocollybia butyracea TaxID=206335 RepID=A0A9P5Q415_9AGAR|nr:hypothetical protein BDP27DRAFT_315427 [Rhodocollybia butyracea]